MDPTTRFSDRVADYAAARPDYPNAIIDYLEREAGLGPESHIADVGAGTGISTQLFIRRGYTVVALEPNDAMRGALAESLAEQPAARVVDGTAEATTLDESSVDAVVAAQAFHWFDPEAARREFERILRPGGQVILLWNERRLEDSPFNRAYENLLLAHCPDYTDNRRTHFDDASLAAFFAPQGMCSAQFPHDQQLDWAGLRARLLSSSYVPKSSPGVDEILAAARKMFETYAEDGAVTFAYDAFLFRGRL